jgi:hypothetical protein
MCNARLPSRLVDLAFAKAAALIPDPAFALRAGECWHPSNLGTMGYAWLSSRTLHTGAEADRTFRLHPRQPQSPIAAWTRRRPVASSWSMAAAIRRLVIRLPIHAVAPARHVPNQLRRQAERCGAFSAPAGTRRPTAMAETVRLHDNLRFGALEDSFCSIAIRWINPLPSANVPLANTFDRILTEQLSPLLRRRHSSVAARPTCCAN